MKILQFGNFSAYFKIKKEYYTALEGIDLDVEQGEFLAIVGPSGCGKTTLLRSVMGMVPYFTGELLLDGKKIEETDISTQNIAYVSQEVTLYPSMTVYENIAYPLKVMGLEEGEIDQRVRELAEQLGISFLLTRKPRQLSVGQRQRVAIAHALVKGPRLALFDEPFSNLEPQLRAELGALLREVHRQLGSTFLFVTHDTEEAHALADRVVTLEQGMVRRIDAPERRIPERTASETVWQTPPKPEAKPRRRWKWFCLVAAMLAVIIGASISHGKMAVPEETRLKISFVGTGLEAQRLEDDLLAALTAGGVEIEEVVMDSLRYDDGYTQGSAVWVRSREADLMIFTEEFLFNQIGTTYFPPLSGDWPESCIYRENQTNCGLILGSRFSEYYDGEDQCVLFFTDAGLEKTAARAAVEWLLEVG